MKWLIKRTVHDLTVFFGIMCLSNLCDLYLRMDVNDNGWWNFVLALVGMGTLMYMLDRLFLKPKEEECKT